MAKAIVSADSAVRPDPIPLTFWPTRYGRSGVATRHAARFTV